MVLWVGVGWASTPEERFSAASSDLSHKPELGIEMTGCV
jgi:hypothetical protein